MKDILGRSLRPENDIKLLVSQLEFEKMEKTKNKSKKTPRKPL